VPTRLLIAECHVWRLVNALTLTQFSQLSLWCVFWCFLIMLCGIASCSDGGWWGGVLENMRKEVG
jgi:hypothetical protein